MMGQIAIAIALPGFNVLGRSVTPTLLLMDHFLIRFFSFRSKYEENFSTRCLNVMQNAPLNSVLFSSSLTCATVSNAY